MSILLNASNIKKAKPGEVLRDDNIPGLHLRVFDSKSTYYLQYRTRQAQERKPKIGTHGVITLEEAREKARVILGQVAEGKDPSLEVSVDRGAKFMSDVWADCWAAHYKHKASADDVLRAWERDMAPKIGNMLARDIDFTVLQDLHNGMKGTPVKANRTMAYMSVLLNHAERKKWRPINSNPCRLIKRFPEKKIVRYLGEPEEVLHGQIKEEENEAVRLWKALNTFADERPASVGFIKVSIFSGARPCEVARARPEWLKGDVLTIPPEHHKTGWKTGQPRTIVLPRQAMEIINALPKTNDTLLGILDPKATWVEVREMARIKKRLRYYDLRHTFATTGANEGGLSGQQVGNLLGHQGGDGQEITQVYMHKKLHIMRVHAQQVADLLEGILTGKIRSPGHEEDGNIAAFKQAA